MDGTPTLDRAAVFPAGSRLVGLYDGHCGLCRASVRWLRRRDRTRRLHLMPLQTPGVLDFFQLPERDALGEIHVYSRSGEHRAGADGVLWAVTLLPRYRALGPLLRLPGVMPIARAVYRQIAKRRRRDLCAGDACPVH
jgi:predicted DCC family thiol-disulfide oxidoreductase YuxK